MIDDPALAEQLGKKAGAEFEAKYTPEKNYKLVMETYNFLTKDARS